VLHDAYGLTIDSQFALPSPKADPRRSADVRIIHQHVDDGAVQFAPLEDDGGVDLWIEIGWDADRTVLRFPGLRAEMFDDRIHVDPVDRWGEDLVAHVIADHVIPRWLSFRGDLVLHAGAVSVNGLAVALIGEPGQGKSSMTTALGTAGWQVLTDDACRLVKGADTWRAYPSYPGIRLLSDSRRALVPDVPSTPMAAGADKHRLAAGTFHAISPAPLVMVIELGGENAGPSLRRQTLAQATASLARHSFYLSPRRVDLAPEAFIRSSALASDVPCLLLEFPRRWSVYPEVIELIQRQIVQGA
jgi:hypothetical protein